MSGRLVVCATPIGNLGDVTLRVLDALREADTIAAEDTRVTRKLLARYEIETRLERCDEHTVERQAPALVARMAAGEVIALVSDAGTPGVSDPGARLVDACLEAEVPVEVLPGASAILTALVGSGLPTDAFYFGGFLPRKVGERRRALELLAGLDATLIFYESPHRTAATLATLAEMLPGRSAAMARELTKLHEEIVRGPVEELAETIAARESLKGEVVLLVGPPRAQARARANEDEVLSAVEARVAAGESRSAAVKSVAKELGLTKSEVYEIAHRPARCVREGRLGLLDRSHAVRAHGASLDLDGLGGRVSADGARVLVLLEDDAVALDKDRDGVLHVDSECAAKLHRDDDPTEVVDVAYDSGVVHDGPPFIVREPPRRCQTVRISA